MSGARILVKKRDIRHLHYGDRQERMDSASTGEIILAR